MPIYEFYCDKCNVIYNFFSARINTQKRPMCPKCGGGPLDRLVSKFSVLRGTKEERDVDMPDLDESKLEKAMSLLEREAEGFDTDDPRQSADLMRKLCDMTGLQLGSGMEEALRRLEAGDDPDQVEAEMGDVLNGDELFSASGKARERLKRRAPARDETLYDL